MQRDHAEQLAKVEGLSPQRERAQLDGHKLSLDVVQTRSNGRLGARESRGRVLDIFLTHVGFVPSHHRPPFHEQALRASNAAPAAASAIMVTSGQKRDASRRGAT